MCEHAGFVDDHGGAGGELPGRVGWPVGSVPFVEEFGDGVGIGCRSRFRGRGRLSRWVRPRTPAARGAVRSPTAAWSMVVLPAPAGPTTSTSRSWPATAAAASACITSNPSPSIGGRWGGWVVLGVDRPGEDVFFFGEDLVAGVVAGDGFDPHRPTIGASPPAVGSVGSRSTQCSRTVSTARSTRRGPAGPVEAGLWSGGVADRLHHVEAMPRRPPLATPRRSPRRPRPAAGPAAVAGGCVDAGVQRCRGDADGGGFVEPPCPQIGDTVAGLVTRVSTAASRPSAPRSFGVGSRPSRAQNSASLAASAASTSAVRFENTSRSSAGMPAISACPFTISPERDAVAGGELGAQHRLIQPTERPLEALQHAGVERQPATVLGLHLGRDHHMGVQLRVIEP